MLDSLKYIAKGSKDNLQGFPGGPVVKNLPANAGDRASHMPQSN